MGTKYDNVSIFIEYTERIKKGDTQSVYEYWAPGFFTHVVERLGAEVAIADHRDGEVAFWKESAKAFPDREFVIQKIWPVEDGEVVVAHWTMRGTHTGGSFFGAPATGKRVQIDGTAIVRFENGKFVEHWGGPHCMYGIGLLAAEPPRL